MSKKELLLKQLASIPEDSTLQLLSFTTELIKSVTPLYCIGIEEEETETLNTFRNYCNELLLLYNTTENPDQNDTYWLLYWGTHDCSLFDTFNGYNYLWILNENRTIISHFQYLKPYMECIVKLIKKDNFH